MSAGSHLAVVRRDGQFGLEAVPTPEPGPKELLIAPLLAGLCGTDIQMVRGIRDDPAPVIGHEGVARVVATGAPAPFGLEPGTLVTVNPTHPTDPAFLLGHNVNGLFQERTLIPASAVSAQLVTPVRELEESVLFALLEPLAVVGYSLSLLRDARPETLVVFGDGVVGHLAIRAAAAWLGPAVRTVLVHHTARGLEWSDSRKIRPDVLVPFGDDDTLRAATRDTTAAAIIATPRTGTLDCLQTAVERLPEPALIDMIGGLPPRARSRLLPGADLNAIRAANHAGHPDIGRITPRRSAHGSKVRLTGHRGVGNHHLLRAASELARAPGRYRDLVTHTTDLEGAAAIMNRLRRSLDRTVDGRRLIKLAIHIGSNKAGLPED